MQFLDKLKTEIGGFIVVTCDYSGLGLAKMIQDGGGEVLLAIRPKDDEDNLDAFDCVGDGIVTKIALDDCLKHRSEYKDHLWIWDQNHNSADAELLRKEGFLVLGGHALTDKMEHDREFGLSLVKKAGLASPESQQFSDIGSGVAFLEANADRAFVFKPDEPDNESWVTTVPDSSDDEAANQEILKFLAAMPEGKGEYILQERKSGIEINVEFFVFEGKPFFSHANFECKRKDNKDLGRMIGCSQDTEFVIPLESKILKETLWKLIALPDFKGYTGLLDMNLIVADNEYYFLEFCGRFGYNAHPNLFGTLAISPIGEILTDFVRGSVDDFGRHFRSGFGASITLWIDKPVMGLPIIFNDRAAEQAFYHFDTYEEEGDLRLAGYANEVGVIVAHDYDMMSAAAECLRRFERIHYPGRTGRTDLDKKDYLSNPHERLVAADAMKLFDV